MIHRHSKRPLLAESGTEIREYKMRRFGKKIGDSGETNSVVVYQFLVLGLAIGTGVGISFGLIFDMLSIGMRIGASLGLVFGYAIGEKRKKD